MIYTLLIVCLVAASASSMHLIDIEMNNLTNLADLSQSVPIYFKFCLRTGERCQDQFQTQVIGDGFITQEQFYLTTNLIQLRFENTNDQKLLIRAMNGRDDSLISSWSLRIVPYSGMMNKWLQFKQTSVDQELSFQYRVKCDDRFTGSNCDQPKCSPGCDLQKGGFCTVYNECLCRPGWTGSNCDQVEKSVESGECDLDCQNGGVCQIDPLTRRPRCKCNTQHYAGDMCEIRIIKECKSNSLCQNGARCFADNDECQCLPGWGGQYCEIKRYDSQCGQFTCYNGGTCYINNRNEYACLCHTAFSGKNCQLKQTFTPISTVQTTTEEVISSTTTSAIITDSIPIDGQRISQEQIVLMALVGILIPILAILLALVFYRLHLNKFTSLVNSPSSSINKDDEFKQVKAESSQRVEKNENFYVTSSYLDQMSQEKNNKPSNDDNSEDYCSISGLEYQFIPDKQSYVYNQYVCHRTLDQQQDTRFYDSNPSSLMISIV